jgi:hypothetical protein
MIRTRVRSASEVPFHLLYSVRTPDHVIYANELYRVASSHSGVEVAYAFTRAGLPGDARTTGRLTARDVAAVAASVGGGARTYICGPNGFVENASQLLLDQGYPAELIRTERFGGTGELHLMPNRLLLPGLGGLLASGRGPALSLVGSGMEEWTDDHWRARVIDAFGSGDGRAGSTAREARYLTADATDEKDLRRLLEACHGQVTIFFALPPAVTAQVCRTLEAIGLPPGTRLALEKPFGTGAAGAASLNNLLLRLVPENQIHPRRPLPRQVDGAQHPRPAVRQPGLRAGTKCRARCVR